MGVLARCRAPVLLVTRRVTGRPVWSNSVDTQMSSRRFRTSVFFSVMRSSAAFTAFGSQCSQAGHSNVTLVYRWARLGPC